MATTIERAVWLMKAIADGNYGYSQPHRNGEYGKEPSDFDCSSSVTYSWQSAGVPVRDAGASTTSNMYKPFLACGFKDVTSQIDLKTGKGLRAGDVLLYPYDGKYGHTEMMITDKLICGARRDENGKDGWESGGAKPGDQTGAEIEYGPYYNFATGWKYVLRYTAEDEPDEGKFEATLRSSTAKARYANGSGKIRNLPYVIVTRKELGFQPRTIICQEQREVLCLSQYVRDQLEDGGYIFVSDRDMGAQCGVAAGSKPYYFNPDADTLKIPVERPDRDYIVKIYS